jgi:hypothetical protein
MSPTIDINDIGGTAEVAAILSCPKQQIHALLKRSDFPRPITKIAATPIWNLAQVRAFGATWVRRKSA